MIDIASAPRLLTLLTLLFAALLLACGSQRQEPSELTGAAAAKVDPDLRRSASLLLSEGHADSSLSVLVQVAGGDARTQLEKAGMRVDTLVGDVATGWIDVRSLADVAALESVVQVQPSRRQKTY
jgi:hypothetical protein